MEVPLEHASLNSQVPTEAPFWATREVLRGYVYRRSGVNIVWEKVGFGGKVSAGCNGARELVRRPPVVAIASDRLRNSVR